MNAASEATLAELLAVNKQMAGAISQMAAKSSGGGAQPTGGSGGGPTSVFSKGLDSAGIAAKGLASLFTGSISAAASLVGSGFGKVAETGKAVFQAQKALAQSTVDGAGSLSSF
jgi:hypothetical protein